MSAQYNENIRRLRQLSEEMIALAEEGDQFRDDTSCGIMYGILRDAGYRLKQLAREECNKHKRIGKWD